MSSAQKPHPAIIWATATVGIVSLFLAVEVSLLAAVLLLAGIIYLIGYCWCLDLIWAWIVQIRYKELVWPPIRVLTVKPLVILYALFWPIIWLLRIYLREVGKLLEEIPADVK